MHLIATKAFDDAARLLGVDTPNPGMCWLLDTMGVDPHTVSEDGVYPDGYFRIVRRAGEEPLYLFEPWTDEQVEILEEWKEHLEVA